MTLQIEEADANKLRERLDSEALAYMKLRESVFVGGTNVRASSRIPMGISLDAEVCVHLSSTLIFRFKGAKNEILKLEAAVREEEQRKASTGVRNTLRCVCLSTAA